MHIIGFLDQMKIGLLKIRSFYVRSNGIGLITLGLLKLGLLGGHRLKRLIKTNSLYRRA